MAKVKDFSGYAVAGKMGVNMESRAICPGCGKVERMDTLLFELEVLAGRIIEAEDTTKADGVKWCPACN